MLVSYPQHYYFGIDSALFRTRNKRVSKLVRVSVRKDSFIASLATSRFVCVAFSKSIICKILLSIGETGILRTISLRPFLVFSEMQVMYCPSYSAVFNSPTMQRFLRVFLTFVQPERAFTICKRFARKNKSRALCPT